MNEDKIKALKYAIRVLSTEDNYTGICDALNYTAGDLELNSLFRKPGFYGIKIPKKKYKGSMTNTLLFSYPCTIIGKKQRIQVLEKAIKKLQS